MVRRELMLGLTFGTQRFDNKQGWLNKLKRDKTRTRFFGMAYIFPLDFLSIFSIIVAG